MSPRISADQRDDYLQARREQILDAAIDVFSKNGFARTSVDEIACAAGIAKGTIYLYFPSKENIFQVALEERSFVPRLSELILGNDPPEITLRIIAGGFFSFMEAHQAVVRMTIIDCVQFPDHAHIVYDTVIHNGIDILSGYLDAQCAAGITRPLENSILTARAFFSLLVAHFFMQELMDGKKTDPIDRQAWIDECVRIFINSIGLVEPVRSPAG